MTDCMFCKIASGEAKASVVYEDENCMAFRDINPNAPTHIIIIPKTHIESLNDLQGEDEALVGRITMLARQLARNEKIDEGGYRIVWNCNENGGQTVPHLHAHLLGGCKLTDSLG